MDKINNPKIKKILNKNEVEDIEKCLISMSEDGTFRNEISNLSDKLKDTNSNNNTSYLEIETKNKNLAQTFGNKLNINKDNFRNDTNPNMIFSNKNFINLKTKIESKKGSDSKNNNNTNNLNNYKNFGKINTNKFNNYNRNFNINKNDNDNIINNNIQTNNIAMEILENLPNKIFIDSEEYNKLKYKPQLDIKTEELICMKVYEKIESLSSQLSELRRNFNTIREQKLTLEEDNSFLKLEKEKMIKTKEYQIETLMENNKKFELENKKINEINKTQIEKIQEFTPKVYKFEELNEKYLNIIKENKSIIEAQKVINDNLQNIKKEKEEIYSKHEIIKLELEALKNDKFFLGRENTSLSEKNNDLIEKIKSLEEEIKQMKKINNEYIEKLTNKNCNIDNIYDQKLKNELFDMKKKYTDDMENLKKLYDEISEKRCTYLQDERDDYKQKNIKLEKIIKDKEESLDFINNEIRHLNKQTTEEISYLKIQLKIKSEELNRISNIYEENINLIKIFKIENESMKEKIDILRTDLIQKESNYKEEASEYRSQINNMKEKIANYEHIENELDKVIMESSVNVEK
jgi:progesterone-induced-blocking factor 1